MLLAAAAVAAAFSFVVHNPARIILPTGLLSAAAFAVFRAGNVTHSGTVWSTAFAFAVGIAAVFCTQWLKASAAAFATGIWRLASVP
jgi:hypothetical protein